MCEHDRHDASLLADIHTQSIPHSLFVSSRKLPMHRNARFGSVSECTVRLSAFVADNSEALQLFTVAKFHLAAYQSSRTSVVSSALRELHFMSRSFKRRFTSPPVSPAMFIDARKGEPDDTEISIPIRALDSNPRDSGFPREGDNEIPARILNRIQLARGSEFTSRRASTQRYDKISHNRACHRISFGAL